MFTEESVQRYARGLYPVGALLVLVPLVDLALRSFPPQFGTLQWRFATAGLVLNNTGTILLGLGLIGLVAALAGHRRTLRALGITTLVLAVVVLALVALFALDAVQIRRLAAPNFKRPILASGLGAMFTGLFGIVALVTMGRAALAASRPTRATAAPRSRTTAAAPLVAAGTPVSTATNAPVGAPVVTSATVPTRASEAV